MNPCVEICGDQYVVGTEVCDKNSSINLKNDILCINDCKGVLAGAQCLNYIDIVSGLNFSNCFDTPNGYTTPTEECDDNNLILNDGCDYPSISNGYSCKLNEYLTSVCWIKCGDGMRNDIKEECDDFNNLDNDGCSS